MTFIPSRRQHARFTCKLPLRISGAGAKAPVEGTMLNVGMGGAYVRVVGTLRLATILVRVAFGNEALSLEARVLRSAGVDAGDSRATMYGIEFLNDNSTQGRLRLLLDRVRTSSQGGAPSKMTGYWK